MQNLKDASDEVERSNAERMEVVIEEEKQEEKKV
jgi:hypothetical protein